MSTSDSFDINTSPIQLHTTLYYLASIGWRLLPVESHGKKPLLKQWPQNASCDVEQLAKWAVEFPGCNWGVATGVLSGVFVLDVDGDAGRASVEALVAQGLALPDTLTVETGKGLHFYFKVPATTYIHNSVSSLGAGLDIRGDGGYVLIPPSVHESGRLYQFRASLNPENAIASAPDWLLQRVVKVEAPVTPSLPIGERRAPTDHERAYAAKALASEVEKLSAMKPGQGRNDTLNSSAHSMGTIVASGWIDRSAVEAELMNAAERNGYILKDGKTEAWNTLQSGLNAGMKNPRPPIVDVPLAVDPSTFAHKIDAVPLPANGYNTDATVEFVSMASIESKPISWLWRDYLPLGKLVLLAGAAGTGKSTLAFSIAATVSSGGRWPDGTKCRSGHVLIWSSEDDVSDTIKPRLIAMDGDMTRVHVISVVSGLKGKMPFDPANHIPILKSAVQKQGGCSLLIVDPIVSAVTGDINKSNEVRRSLQSIVDFASELNCAVVGISHFAKGSAGSNPADRVIGSVAFGAFARIVLVAAKDEDSHKRVFTRAKSNIGEDSGGFYYGIQPVPMANSITATRVVWGGPIDGSSRDILAIVEHTDDSPIGAIQEAKKFLIEELKTAPRRAKELIEIAKQAGINEKTLQRARQQLGIETSKDGMAGGWVWSRPFTSLNGLTD